jgi:hypothetical protein
MFSISVIENEIIRRKYFNIPTIYGLSCFPMIKSSKNILGYFLLITPPPNNRERFQKIKKNHV